MRLLPVTRGLNRGIENAIFTYCAPDVTTSQAPRNVRHNCPSRVCKYNCIRFNLDMNLLARFRASGLNVCGLAKKSWKNQGVCGTECVEGPAIQNKSVVCGALGEAETNKPSLIVSVCPWLLTKPLLDVVDWQVCFRSNSSNGHRFSFANKSEKRREEGRNCHHVGE